MLLGVSNYCKSRLSKQQLINRLKVYHKKYVSDDTRKSKLYLQRDYVLEEDYLEHNNIFLVQ